LIYLNLFRTFTRIPPPHGLSRGNLYLSIRRTFTPFSERNFAAVEPAGPAPTTTTSYFFILNFFLILFTF
jgi:hypothetical protein